MKENLTREEAIEQVGKKAVEKVERLNCEPTGRLQHDWDNTIEYKASIVCKSLITGTEVVLDAMYYPSKSEFVDADGEEIEDLGNIDWHIDHYRVS